MHGATWHTIMPCPRLPPNSLLLSLLLMLRLYLTLGVHTTRTRLYAYGNANGICIRRGSWRCCGESGRDPTTRECEWEREVDLVERLRLLTGRESREWDIFDSRYSRKIGLSNLRFDSDCFVKSLYTAAITRRPTVRL